MNGDPAAAGADAHRRHTGVCPQGARAMIPRIQTGNSFKGAALYYLHDKRLEGEEERMTVSASPGPALNTLEDDPEG